MPLRTRLLTATAAAALMLACMPSFALIYDGASARVGNGPMPREGTSVVWIASPFIVSQQAYATTFSIAAARAMGPLDAGFDVWLSSNLAYGPELSLASWRVVPSSPIATYSETVLPEPVFLKADHAYYVMIAGSTPDFRGAVSYSAKGYYGMASADYGKTWLYLAQPIGLKVDGYFVPEPSGLVALLAGVAGAVRWRRR